MGSSCAIPDVAKHHAHAGDDANDDGEGYDPLHHVHEYATVFKVAVAGAALVAVIVAAHGFFPSFKISNRSRLALRVQ